MNPEEENFYFKLLSDVIKYCHNGQVFEISTKMCRRFMCIVFDTHVGQNIFFHYLAFMKQYPDGDLTKCRIPIERISGSRRFTCRGTRLC